MVQAQHVEDLHRVSQRVLRPPYCHVRNIADMSMASSALKPPLDRGHPLPRRSPPENSVTLHHHRLARDASTKGNPKGKSTAPSLLAQSSRRRDSSRDSLKTAQSDPKTWFDLSNRNSASTYAPGSMDVDPPFYQKETDSSNEGLKEGEPGFLDTPAFAPRIGLLSHPAVTHSSSADDYRSVIDDLTIENKRLKEELKRYKRLGTDMMRKDKLFEIKVHGLPKVKKRELEVTLRDFAASLEGSSEAASECRKLARYPKNILAGGPLSKHASPSSSQSRPVDSAYASMSGGVSSRAPTYSGPSLKGPSLAPSVGPSLGRAQSSTDQSAEPHLEDTPDGLLPRHVAMTDREKKKLVVRKLEQLFTGKLSGQGMQRTPDGQPAEARLSVDIIPVVPASGTEASREAQIQPNEPLQKKPRARENVSLLNFNADQIEREGNGHGSGDASGDGSGSGNFSRTSPPSNPPQEQRPTRPHDLDPDRKQIPSENMDYIRHLGLVATEPDLINLAGEHTVSPDADGWVYLNLLCNLAQLHMINVTPSFIRFAVTEMSTKFQLSPDGRKIRWRGGTDGTKFSSDSSGNNSQQSPSTDDTDGSNDVGQRKKQNVGITTGNAMLSAPSSNNDSKYGPNTVGTSESFHYKPLFVRLSSSMETSLEEEGSAASSAVEGEDSHLGNTGNSRWGYSGCGSSRPRKRRHNGAIIYYNGAPFCTDLSGDPGDASPTLEMASAGKKAAADYSARQPPLSRSPSEASPRLQPLGDGSLRMSEALDMDASLIDDGVDLFGCDQMDQVQSQAHGPALEPSGLGGVLPEDHFAVTVITRRPRLGCQGRHERHFASQIADTADSTDGGSAATTNLCLELYRSRTKKRGDVQIEYLDEITRRSNPLPLPPPAMFFPPFSTDSDEDWDSEDESEADESSVSSRAAALVSQRANPHHSDPYPNMEEFSSDDEENELDDTGSAHRCAHRTGGGPTDSKVMAGRCETTGSGGEGRHPQSSAATAGGEESGYSSSVEDD